MKFPKPYQNQAPSLRKHDRFIVWLQLTSFLSVVLLVCCSCGGTKVVPQMVRDVSVDTVYLSNVQYDSIYIIQDHISEYHLGKLPPLTSDGKYLDIPTRTDTLFIKDKSIEYRYRLLKDTIRVVERDSIPYEVTITKVKEVDRPLTWCDYFSRAVLWINIVFAIYWLIRLIRKIKRP